MKRMVDWDDEENEERIEPDNSACIDLVYRASPESALIICTHNRFFTSQSGLIISGKV